ncbi:hypothetical protein Taro_001000 [Colocasia esculenta]|uniref:Uncharacterized protein n=1 Tax=Colocasia esculenta TaxID=4460 RepID=A0A843TGS7_COLES|nr:hypothetical protein [Colocasia esculenta]
MPRLKSVELFSTKSSSSDETSSSYDWWSCFLSDCGYRPDAPLSTRLPPECVGDQAWACWERHLVNIIGQAGPLEYILLLETASTLHDVWIIMGGVSCVCKIDVNELVSTPPSRATAAPALRIGGDRNPGGCLGASSFRDVKADKGKAIAYCSPDDEYIPLLGGSSLPDKGECGSSSQIVDNFGAEIDDIEPSSHCPLPEVKATESDDSASIYAEYMAFAEQYPFTPVDAYIAKPDDEYPAAELTSSGDQVFCNQLYNWGMMDSYSTFATSSPSLSSPFFDPQAYVAFQIGGTADGNGTLEQASYSPGPSNLLVDGGSLDPPPGDFLSDPQEFHAEDSNFARPSISEVAVEERNPLPDNPPSLNFDEGGSPALEVEALSEHGVKWPTRDQPSLGPADDDLWDFLFSRVRAVVDSENPPPIEAVKRILQDKTMLAFNSGITQSRWMEFVESIWGEVCHCYGNVVWAPYDQRIQTLEGDLCLLASDADRRGSRITDVHKGRKTRKLKITAEMENIVRLQRELEEARSSLDQEVKVDAKDSEEEAAFIKDDEEYHRSISSKTKEVERLKRKKPSWLLGFDFDFGLDSGFCIGLAYLGGLLAMVSYLCGLLAMVFEYSLPLWFAGYGFDIAYLCGLLAMPTFVVCWLWFWNMDFGIAYLCGLLAMVLEFDFCIAYLCGLLAMVLEYGFWHSLPLWFAGYGFGIWILEKEEYAAWLVEEEVGEEDCCLPPCFPVPPAGRGGRKGGHPGPLLCCSPRKRRGRCLHARKPPGLGCSPLTEEEKGASGPPVLAAAEERRRRTSVQGGGSPARRCRGISLSLLPVLPPHATAVARLPSSFALLLLLLFAAAVAI